jgi:hypothetical protein
MTGLPTSSIVLTMDPDDGFATCETDIHVGDLVVMRGVVNGVMCSHYSCVLGLTPGVVIIACPTATCPKLEIHPLAVRLRSKYN